MNLVTFCFWADYAVREVLTYSIILLMYPTFEFIFHMFMGKTIIKFLYKVRTKKLINIKVRKL